MCSQDLTKIRPKFKKHHLLPIHMPRIFRFTMDLVTLWERKGPQGYTLALSVVGGISCERNRVQTDTKEMDLP
jgi:hypothetical protein